MEKSKTILVPVDFSASANTTIQHAAHLARVNKSDVVLIHVIETLFEGFSLAGLTLKEDSAEQKLVEAVENRLKSISTEYNEQGFHFTYRIEFGSVHKTIVRIADELNATYIVMGAHGIEGFEEYLIGSNSFRVAATANCPVITLPNDDAYTKGYKVIVMPIDTSFYSRQKVKTTAQIAKAFNSKIFVFGVSIDTEPEAHIKLTTLTQQVGEYLHAHAVEFETAIETGGNITDNTILFSKAVKADLISIMTEQEPSVRSLIMGEFAQQMINKSPIPVLSIRPKEVSGQIDFSL
jgi:nucleotide-binding universal stress UspA family protein